MLHGLGVRNPRLQCFTRTGGQRHRYQRSQRDQWDKESQTPARAGPEHGEYRHQRRQWDEHDDRMDE
ncbi:hypothetical protein GCM10022238_35980 [Gordonia hankookensis]